MRNTKKQGLLRFLIYKRSKDKLFTGICLDLDIVEQSENPEKLRKSLEKAAQGYIEAVIKKDLDGELLNKPAPKKYWKIISEIEKYLRLIHKVSVPKQRVPITNSQIFTKELKELSKV